MSEKERGAYSEDALRWGTFAHYEDAERYDRTYRRRHHDVTFYRLFAAEHGGPILELGAGTGRITIPLARDGHDVTALEQMVPMIDRLYERLEREPDLVRARVHVVRGDLRRFRVPAPAGRRARSFPLVIAPFNVLMHLYDRRELERMLRSVREHLAPRGLFVFDVRMPDIRSFTRDPERAFKCAPLRDPRDGVLFQTSELFAYDATSQVQMITSVYREAEEPHRTFVKPLAHRQFFPQELELLLHYNGFSILERWGDFERGPQHVDCESQVIVARARRPRR